MVDTPVRITSGLVEEFAKFAHEAVEAWRERAVKLEGNVAKLLGETNAFGEETKFGDDSGKNRSKAAFYSFITGLMITHIMKSRGIRHAPDVQGVIMKGQTSKRSRLVSRGVVYES
jgi:hypothetical protein